MHLTLLFLSTPFQLVLLYTCVSFILLVSLSRLHTCICRTSQQATAHSLYNKGRWIISDKGKVQLFDLNF